MAFIPSISITTSTTKSTFTSTTSTTSIHTRRSYHTRSHRHPRLTPRATAADTTAAKEGSLEVAWPPFAERMKSSGEIPELSEWHALLDGIVGAGDAPGCGVWVLNLMRDTGRRPTAATYERVLAMCHTADDRVAAFHLVEHMYKDKVLLGDVQLPDGMESTLRKILPPDAFE